MGKQEVEFPGCASQPVARTVRTLFGLCALDAVITG